MTENTAPRSAYAKDEFGNMIETNASITRRLAHAHGFQPSRIVLMEAGYRGFEGPKGKTYCYCSSVSFSVNGIGYSSDFETLVMDEAYNA